MVPGEIPSSPLSRETSGLYINCFVIYLDFPFNSHSRRKKQKTDRATTAELHPGQDTFAFDQGHMTKNQPITVLVLLSESLGI